MFKRAFPLKKFVSLQGNTLFITSREMSKNKKGKASTKDTQTSRNEVSGYIYY